jgi:hypothetical protein
MPAEPPEFVADLDGDGRLEWVPVYAPPTRPFEGCPC